MAPNWSHLGVALREATEVPGRSSGHPEGLAIRSLRWPFLRHAGGKSHREHVRGDFSMTGRKESVFQMVSDAGLAVDQHLVLFLPEEMAFSSTGRGESPSQAHTRSMRQPFLRQAGGKAGMGAPFGPQRALGGTRGLKDDET